MPVSHNGRSDGKSLGMKHLGMDERISRRDFLNSTLLASGSLLMGAVTPLQLLGEQDDWTGYGGVGDYSKSNGNTFEVVAAGHRIRANEFERMPADVIDTGETFDCVVVGGGISGLAAALLFLRKAGRFLRSVSTQFSGTLLRLDRFENASTSISEVGGAGEGNGAQQNSLRHGRKPASDVWMVFRRQVWPAAWDVDDRSLGKEAGGRTDCGVCAQRVTQVAGRCAATREEAAVFWRRDLKVSRLDHARGTHGAALRHQS